MKKIKLSTLGFVGTITLCLSSCNDHTTVIPVRVNSVDPYSGIIVVDSTSAAVTRNIRKKPNLQLSGPYLKLNRPDTGDILVLSVDSSETEYPVKVVNHIPYSLN